MSIEAKTVYQGLLLALPTALLAGSLSGFFLEPPRSSLWVVVLLAAVWFLAERPLWAVLPALCLSFGLGNQLCRDQLTRIEAQQPKEHQLDATYRIEGRYLRSWQGRYGPALVLDKIRVLSPKQVEFKLDRLTVYVPDSEQLPKRRSRVEAWIRLKKRRDARPMPWPIQSMRERYMPAYRGTVKDARLWSFAKPAQAPAPHLNRGNRELLGLMLAGMPSALWRDRLEPFGVGHLLAISGLHCIFVFLALQCLLFPLRRPLLRISATAVGLLLFAHWVGWSTSVTRASLMLLFWQILPIWNRERSWLRLWFALVLIGVLADPLLFLQRGFWYSFAASLGLVLGGRFGGISTPLEHPLLRRLRPFLPILGAQLFVMPINLMFDGYSRFTNLFWNLMGFAFLVVLAVVLLLALVAAHWSLLAQAANGFEVWVGRFLEADLIGDVGFEWVRFPQEPYWVFGILFLMGVALFAAGREWRWYAAIGVLGLFSVFGLPHKGARLVMLDVGQGLCLLQVDEAGRGILYDAGGRLPGGLRLDRLAYLMGARQIERAYISHHDQDHYGLLAFFEGDFPLLVPRGQLPAFRATESLAHYAFEPVEAGHSALWGGLQATVVWPDPGHVYPNDNEESLVVRLQGEGWWLLLTGDAGLWMERRMDMPKGEGVALLQVGHHGSRSATGKAFLDVLQPKVAYISSGRGNRFSHPHPDVLRRLQQMKIDVRDTSGDGSIVIYSER